MPLQHNIGNKLLFLEAGSNSNYPANESLIKEIYEVLDIPIIVGGGIKNKEDAKKISSSGASYIVIGSLLEESIDYLELLDIMKLYIHEERNVRVCKKVFNPSSIRAKA